jgi:hypothetical protein
MDSGDRGFDLLRKVSLTAVATVAAYRVVI